MSFDTEKFRELLSDNQDWPMLYYFKFIAPNKEEKLTQLRKLFINQEAITYRTSKDIKFIALSCKQYMVDPDSIIAIYEAAAKIEGVIAL